MVTLGVPTQKSKSEITKLVKIHTYEKSITQKNISVFGVWIPPPSPHHHHHQDYRNQLEPLTRPGSKVISLINFEPFMGLKIGLTLREVGGN